MISVGNPNVVRYIVPNIIPPPGIPGADILITIESKTICINKPGVIEIPAILVAKILRVAKLTAPQIIFRVVDNGRIKRARLTSTLKSFSTTEKVVGNVAVELVVDIDITHTLSIVFRM